MQTSKFAIRKDVFGFMRLILNMDPENGQIYARFFRKNLESLVEEVSHVEKSFDPISGSISTDQRL
jgi:hypothetical protein